MRNRELLFGTLGVCGALGASWLFLGPSVGSAGTLAPSPPISPAASPRSAAASPRTATERPPGHALPPARGGEETPEERARRSLAAFLDWAQYPPTSRPLRERPDRTTPDQVAPRRVLLGGSGPTPGEVGDPPVSLVLRQDRYFVSGGEEVMFEVACVAGGAPVDCAAEAGVLSTPADVAAPAVREEEARVAFVAGEQRGTWRARVQPGARSFSSYTGPIHLEVPIRAAAASGQASFDLFFTPVAPAVWTGVARDQVQDGSLLLCAQLRVAEAGRYLFDARVAGASGEVFAFVSSRGSLAAGEQEVCFTVFGKLVHDAGAAAPFVLQDVEGMLLLEDVYPDRRTVPTWRGPLHRSARHPGSAFSSEAWQSPWKERQVAMWEETLAGSATNEE